MDAVKIYTPSENRAEPLRMNMGLLLERQADRFSGNHAMSGN